MCCRITIKTNPKQLEKRFHAKIKYPYGPRFNAAPGQELPVIMNDHPDMIKSALWGLNPKWIGNVKKSGGIYNIRKETLQDKRTFLGDFKIRRCLVIADGFYEWLKTGSYKQPYRITLKNEEPFAFAGLWEENEVENRGKVRTFAIITTVPNKLIEPIHNRMPVILKPEQEQLWLENEYDKQLFLRMLAPYDSEQMNSYQVGRAVNNTAIDEEELILPLQRLI